MEEKKNWKERLGSYDSWASNESMFITIDGETIYTIDELKSFIQQELDRAREEGRREVLENELFIGDYDVLEQGLKIRTVDRENFLAQIYKTCKDEYDWAFGTATYDQAIKQIENSLNSTLTPYVGTDKMVDEARVKVLSKLTTK